MFGRAEICASCLEFMFLELGAQWIHGRGECPLWKFVNDNQIPGERNKHLGVTNLSLMTRHNSYLGREWRRGRQLLPPGGNSDAGTSFEGMSGVLRRSKRGNLIKFKLIDFFSAPLAFRQVL